MTRQIVPKDQLIQLINTDIGEIPDIASCIVSGIYSLRELDENGCNWSVGYYRGTGIPVEKSRPLVHGVITNLQGKFNLEQVSNIVSNPKDINEIVANTRPQKRLTHICFTVDTNCLNARQSIPEMNRLEQWAEEELIQLLTAKTAQTEMAFGNNADRQKKAYSFIYTMSEITTSKEKSQLLNIEQVIFPQGAKTQNQKNDVDIVFNAGKYPNPLITNDGASKSQPGGILGNREKLMALGIQVITPDEAVTKVKRAIKERDNYAREWATTCNEALPEWVGQD
ncbi:MAG: hypothetical protein PHD43_15090 [Methylococcales bacterium]|nr:hypothetical protein [Methylococcales bacterium]